MDAPFAHVLTTVEELRTHYREPSRLVQRKKVEPPGRRHAVLHRRLALRAPGDGVGPTGPATSRPAVARRASSASSTTGGWRSPTSAATTCSTRSINLTSNGHVGLLFLIPGRDETLRVDGRAWVTTDPERARAVGRRAGPAEDGDRRRGPARVHPLREVVPAGAGVGPLVVGRAGRRTGRLRAARGPRRPRRAGGRRPGQPRGGLRRRPRCGGRHRPRG